jgi:hypothetical protein
MRRGVDYSWDRPDPALLAAAGYTFVVRYISDDQRVNSGRQKNLDAAEAQALSLAGLDLVVVWEGIAADRAPLAGYPQGILDARTAAARAATVDAPATCPIYFAVDWNVTVADLPAIGEYFRGLAAILGTDRVGCYGGYRVVNHLFDGGLIRFGWQTYAWSTFADTAADAPYLHWDGRAQLRQVLNNQRLGAAAVDFNEAHADQFGQWRVSMTTAPQDLLNVRAYLQIKTGLDAASLGIAGDAAHASTGGYHEGRDDLAAAGQLTSDYSVDESVRDSNPTNSASAFDLGNFTAPGPTGQLDRHAVTSAVLAALNRGDPRVADVREMIYSLDDVNVHRWDRLGIRSTGDSSHTFHTHWSFFRDSEGRRDADTNFLGLIKEIFEGIPPEGDDDMFALTLTIPHQVPVMGKDASNNDVVVGYRWPDMWPEGTASYTIPTVNNGIVPWGAAWLSICNDTFGKQYAVRVAGGNGGAHIYANPQLLSNLTRWYVALDNNTAFISLHRVAVDVNDTMTAAVTALVEYARR